MADLHDGASASAPFASSLAGDALDHFDGLGVVEQVALDEALNLLEWNPIPNDAIRLDDAGYAVSRFGSWLVYECDASAASILVWAILPV